jgi:hypothetical protein
VALAGGQDLPGVGLVDDEDVVEGPAADAADHPFAEGVHPGSSWRAEQHVHVLGFEDGVEGLPALAIAVAQQEAQGPHACAQADGHVPGLLHSPPAGGMGGDAGDVQAPRAMFEECQRVQPLAEHDVDVEEIDGNDPAGLIGEEPTPGGADAA